MPGYLLLCVLLIGCVAADGERPLPAASTAPSGSTYFLGPEDQIQIRILEAQEIADKPVRIDPLGYIELPLVGRLRASGFTTDQLQSELTRRLKTYIHDPHVVVSIDEFHSQPVSVIGEVNTPGLQQLKGRKTLAEMLSLAGGVKADGGNNVKITRRMEFGRIPLAGAKDDMTGQFSIAEVKLASIIDAKDPEQNILIQPHDVISVPRGEMVYVVGEVEKSGGFIMNERETITVLQSLSLAGGLRANASPSHARLLRAAPGAQRVEIAVDLDRMLSGKSADQPMKPDDILFVPNNKARRAVSRALEAAITLGTGIVIWRR